MKEPGQPTSNKRSLRTENDGTPPNEDTAALCKRVCDEIAKKKVQGFPCSTPQRSNNMLNSSQSLSNISVPLSQSHAILGNISNGNISQFLNKDRLHDIQSITARIFKIPTQSQPLLSSPQPQMVPNQDYQNPQDPRSRSYAVSPSVPSPSLKSGSSSVSRSSCSDHFQPSNFYRQNNHGSHLLLASDKAEVSRNREFQAPTDPRLRSQSVSAENSNQSVQPVFCTIRVNKHDSREFRSLEALQKEIGNLGIHVSVPPDSPFKNKNKTLDQIIQELDWRALEFSLKNHDPKASLTEISRKNSLHRILKDTWKAATVDGLTVSNHFEMFTMMPVIRVAIKYLPEKILWKRDDGGNTLLHRAIQAKLKEIVELLLDAGSPTYVRNNIGMSPVEMAIVMEQFDILDVLIRYGAKFHHILQEDPTDQCDLHEFQSWLLKAPKAVEVAKTNLKMLENVLHVYRSKLTRTTFDDGPIVCVQRGITQVSGFETTVEFVVPNYWAAQEWDFVLMVIPIYYAKDEEQYSGTSRSPCSLEPILCGQPCVPLFKQMGSIYFYATDAMRNHLNHFKENSRKFPPADAHRFHHDRVCSITLNIPPKVSFDFFACQLVVVKTLDDDVMPIKRKLNTQVKPRKNNFSHGYFRFYDVQERQDP